jgi:hypothetical protein
MKNIASAAVRQSCSVAWRADAGGAVGAGRLCRRRRKNSSRTLRQCTICVQETATLLVKFACIETMFNPAG